MSKWTKSLGEAASGFSPSDSEQEAAWNRIVSSASLEHFDPGEPEIHPRAASPRRRILATGVLVATSFAAGSLATAQSGDSERDVADSYGLQSHPVSPGDVLTASSDGLRINGSVIEDTDCDSTQHPDQAMAIQEIGDHFYCILADTPVDAWLIGQRLLGRTPTQAEIDEKIEHLGK
jgi:hypothetical protein